MNTSEYRNTNDFLIAHVEIEDAKKAARAAMKKAASSPTSSATTPEFDRDKFLGIEVNTVVRDKHGVVEYMSFRNTDAAGRTTSQMMYSDPKPSRYLNTADRKLHSAASESAKPAEAVKSFVGFSEISFPADWYPTAIENRLSLVTPGSADDEVFTAMELCDHVLGSYSYKGVVTEIRASDNVRFDARHQRSTTRNRFCPCCGQKLIATAG